MLMNNESRRTYLERLRNDPRTRTLHDGWVAQATMEAERVYPEWDDTRRAHFAADRALQLALTFILDNDGEMAYLRALVEEQAERISKLMISTTAFVFPVSAPSQKADPATLRPFDINSCVQTADDMRELLRAAQESGDTGHVLRVVRDLASGCDG